MRLASFLAGNRPAYGVVTDDGIIDLSARLGEHYPDLKSLLGAPMEALRAAVATASQPDFRLKDVEFLPTIPNPGKILCVGLNYHAHLAETGKTETIHPTIFLRVAQSQQAHNAPLLAPPESHKFDFEGEVAVIIGKPGRRIAQADAWDHVAGYACYNDGSVRDWQVHTPQWAPGKNFYRTGGFGPWMVTADEIPPGTVMTLTTRLNGEEVQRTTTDLLIFSIPQLIGYLSTIMPLETGDVIVSGTPGGVGAKRNPPLWMKAGDVVEVEVDRIGVLRNPVANDVSAQ